MPVDYKYTDIAKTDITQAILDDCHNTKADLSRSNNARGRVILEFEGDDPRWVARLGLTVRSRADASVFYRPVNSWGLDNT